MAAILGMRGTSSAPDAIRPKTIRDLILKYYQNKAPLTAMLARLKTEKVPTVYFSWAIQGLASRRLKINNAGGYDGAATTLTVKPTDEDNLLGGAYSVRKGMLLRVETTGEMMQVTSDPTSDTSMTVRRALGSITAQAIPENGYIMILATAFPEGSGPATAVSRNPKLLSNVVQIFKSSYSSTGSAIIEGKSYLTGNDFEEKQAQALEEIAIQREMAYIFGQKSETMVDGFPQRTTGGIVYSIVENCAASNLIPVNAVLTDDLWVDYSARIFKYGSRDNGKIALCGNGAITAIEKMARNGKIQITEVNTDDTYGINVRKLITSHGTLYLNAHPLFTENPALTHDILVVDPAFIKERIFRDMKENENVQNNGVDGVTNEFLMESGIEVMLPHAHAYLIGVGKDK